MADSSYTQEQYDALCAAIALGALEVDYGNKRIIYRSLSDMLRLKNKMGEELGILKKDGGSKYAEFNKGLE